MTIAGILHEETKAMATADEKFLLALAGGSKERVIEDFKLFVDGPASVERVRREIEAAVGAHLMGVADVQTSSPEHHPPKDLSGFLKALSI
ncbi:MAG: hypothetical protein K2Q10_02525 [Rhodospirillales bacterium]|nr:hypothetical protein [Rhodospirillales bacterium]